MENSRETEIGIELYNVVSRQQLITWNDLLRTMADIYNRDRDQVFEGMNNLINEGKIVLPKPDTYCLPGTLEKLKKAEEAEKAWKKAYPDSKILSRADFDKLDPAEKMQFATSGGRIGR